MKMQSVKLEKKDSKKDKPSIIADDAPEYPYGMQITIEDKQIDSLGIADMDVGDVVEFMSKGKITSKTCDAKIDGEQCQRVTVQITDIGFDCCDDEETEMKPSEKMYGAEKRGA